MMDAAVLRSRLALERGSGVGLEDSHPGHSSASSRPPAKPNRKLGVKGAH